MNFIIGYKKKRKRNKFGAGNQANMKIFVEIYISTYTKSKEIRKNRTTLYDILDIKTRREHLYIQKFINHDTLCQELVLFSDKEI